MCLAELGSGSREVFRRCKDGRSEGLGERSLNDGRLKALFRKNKQDVITQRQSNRNQPSKFHPTNTARLSLLLSAAASPAHLTTIAVHNPARSSSPPSYIISAPVTTDITTITTVTTNNSKNKSLPRTSRIVLGICKIHFLNFKIQLEDD